MENLLTITLVVIGGFVFLLALGTEVAVAMGVMAAIGLIFFVDQPLSQFAWTSFITMNSFVLTAMPLFIFMGTVFANTGVVRGLFEGIDKWIGSLPGALAMTVIGASAVFGAMSGSSVAAAATFGTIAFPEMERKGFNPKLALGSIAVGGTLSVLIPPSLLLIIYGGWVELSVAKLFAGGMMPGILLALLLMGTVAVRVLINPRLAPKPPSFSWRERIFALRGLAPWAGIVVLVLGVIFGGIMTPTEAAALGAFLSIATAIGYRQMSFKALKDSALAALTVTSMIAFLMVSARMLGHVFKFTGLTGAFSEWVMGLGWGVYGVLALIYAMYLVMGMFVDAISMMVLTIPFIIPVITTLGLDLTWWGVTYVVLAEVGLVTPPFGLNLFALRGTVPKYSIETIALGVLPFLIPTLVTVVLLTAFPDIVLWLPSVLY